MCGDNLIVSVSIQVLLAIKDSSIPDISGRSRPECLFYPEFSNNNNNNDFISKALFHVKHAQLRCTMPMNNTHTHTHTRARDFLNRFPIAIDVTANLIQSCSVGIVGIRIPQRVGDYRTKPFFLWHSLTITSAFQIGNWHSNGYPFKCLVLEGQFWTACSVVRIQ